MPEETETKIIDPEFEEVHNNITLDIRLTKFILLFFLGLTVLIKILFRVPRTYIVVAILFFWFLSYFVNEYSLKKVINTRQLYGLNLRYSLFDILCMTTIVHFLGGVEWIGVFFYILILSLSCNLLPRQIGLLLVFSAAGSYTSLVLLEYFGVIPHETVFLEQTGLYKDPFYVVIMIVIVTVFLFVFGIMSSSFSETLRKKRADLVRARKNMLEAFQEAEKSKDILELKVKERTKDLKRVAGSLEDQVRERTLQLQAKIEEMEKFQKELDRSAKLLVRRDFELMQTKEKREIELEELREKTTQIEEARRALEEANEVLEVRVAARTREWQSLAANLEVQVKERTKEMQDKVRELEKFNSLAIGRELKMVELKREIKELKEELVKLKGQE